MWMTHIHLHNPAPQTSHHAGLTFALWREICTISSAERPAGYVALIAEACTLQGYAPALVIEFSSSDPLNRLFLCLLGRSLQQAGPELLHPLQLILCRL
mmetsp:Transcript_36033/g.94873  ORF Transcript_36033/g.94873 Transcript_36033/m.94873 type:complete len:99 (+) Transcript_36033:75-371(+)